MVMRFSVSLSVPLPSGLTATLMHYYVRYGVQFIISVSILRQPLDSLSPSTAGLHLFKKKLDFVCGEGSE